MKKNPNEQMNENDLMENNIPTEEKAEQNSVKFWTKKTVFFSLLSVFVVSMILLLFIIFFPPKNISEENETEEEPIKTEDLLPVVMDDEMRGVYIASVLNLNFPSKAGLDEKTLKKELDDIVYLTRDTGFDTIFFQVRPTGDALYASEIFPSSRYLVENEGDPLPFDPLAYLIERSAEFEMEVVAWVNPYRITSFSSDSKEEAIARLSESNPARKNPEFCIFYGGKLYYDPALPEVQSLIASGVKELCENYNIKGILYDDYFYPYPVGSEEFDDAASYGRYGNGLSKDDWRRKNVNQMVKMSFDTIKSVSDQLTFGISPFGIWQNSSSDPSGSDTKGMEAYSTLYCDAVAWIDGGYIDYIAPQIYWERGNDAADFATLARWWSAKVDGTRVKLCISHAAYKVSSFQSGACEITEQISYARTLMGSCGNIQYGFDDIRQNTGGLRDEIKSFYTEPFEEEKAVEVTGLHFAQPKNGLVTTNAAYFVSVSSDPSYPVYSAQGKVGRTKSGFFSYRMPLVVGENVLKFTQNGIQYSLKITRKESSEEAEEALSEFRILSVSPADKEGVLALSATSFPVQVTAPAGAVVSVSLGTETVFLKPTQHEKDCGEDLKEIYEGSFKVPMIRSGKEYQSLGSLHVRCVKGDRVCEKTGPRIFVIPSDLPLSATVVNDYSHLKKATDSSFYDDFTPASVGMCSAVTGYFNGYYRLSFGGFVAKENVVVEQKEPIESKITKAESFADEKESGVVLTLDGSPPLTGSVQGDTVELILFETTADRVKKLSPAKKDQLFQTIKIQENENNGSVSVIFVLKNEMNYYGFDYSYADGTLRIAFRQPQKISLESKKPLNGKLIVVDAGHGGSELGAPGFLSYLNEEDLNLRIALDLEQLLTELGATVVMSRNDDSTVSLTERMALLTKTHPDLSVSVHHNSINETKDANHVGGSLGLYWTESGKMLSDCVQKEVADAHGILSRGANKQKLALCRNHRFPQTLVEVSFICAPAEYEAAIKESYSHRSAEAIVNGILSWYKKQADFYTEV